MPELRDPFGLLRLGVDVNTCCGADPRDHFVKAAVGIHPIHAAGIDGAEAMGVFDGQLCLPQASGASNDASALKNSSAILEERVIQVPDCADTAYEFVAERVIGHPMTLWERMHWRKLASISGDEVGLRYAAKSAAEAWVVFLE